MKKTGIFLTLRLTPYALRQVYFALLTSSLKSVFLLLPYAVRPMQHAEPRL